MLRWGAPSFEERCKGGRQDRNESVLRWGRIRVMGLTLWLVVMVSCGGNGAGGNGGHDPCGRTAAVTAATTTVSAEGRTAAETMGWRLQQKDIAIQQQSRRPRQQLLPG